VIHNKFKDLKIGDKGEWFKSNHILLKFIEICTIIPTEEDLIEFCSKPPKNKLSITEYANRMDEERDFDMGLARKLFKNFHASLAGDRGIEPAFRSFGGFVDPYRPLKMVL
jgi:hypothetical protein